MELTKHFNYSEFISSKQYPELASKLKLDSSEKLIIRLLCQSILQPIRDEFGKVEIVSGKRSIELNNKVKGSATSDHLYCSAADISTLAYLPDVYEWIIKNHLPYRQLILYDRSIHVAINIPCKDYKHQAWIN